MAYSRQRPAAPPPPRPIVPPQVILSVGILLLVGGVSFVLANINTQKQAASAAAEEEESGSSSPFEGLPPEEFDERPRRVGSGGPRYARADSVPAVLADHADWDEVQRVVALAESREEQWHQAQRDGELALMREHGRAARQLYEQAMELVGPWLDRFMEDPGESDPHVQRFLFERRGWQRKMMEHRKLFGG